MPWFWFLDVSSHLYMRVCSFVCLSVRMSVHPLPLPPGRILLPAWACSSGGYQGRGVSQKLCNLIITRCFWKEPLNKAQWISNFYLIIKYPLQVTFWSSIQILWKILLLKQIHFCLKIFFMKFSWNLNWWLRVFWYQKEISDWLSYIRKIYF